MDLDPLHRWRVTPPKGRIRTFTTRAAAEAHAVAVDGRIVEFTKWRVRYRDVTGAQRTKDFARKPDANAFAAVTAADLIRGEYVDPRPGKRTFEEYATEVLKIKTLAPASRAKIAADYTNHVFPVLGALQLARIRPTHIQGWVSGITGTMAPTSIEVIYSSITTVFRAALEDGILTKSPCTASITLPAREDVEVIPWPDQWVYAVQEALPARYQAMVPYVAMSGVRQGELFGLTLSQLRMLKAEVDVDWQVQHTPGLGWHLCRPKSKTSRRTIPLPPAAVDALAAHMAEFAPATIPVEHRERDGTHKVWEEQFVFTTPTGLIIRRNTFDGKVWNAELIERAGLPASTRHGDRGMHQLRHFYASTLIAHGVDLNIVKARMGHWSIQETVDTYGHLQTTADDRTRDALGHLFKPSAPEEARDQREGS